eukprot:1138763-Pelagomonas_calceolata.AAC.2
MLKLEVPGSLSWPQDLKSLRIIQFGAMGHRDRIFGVQNNYRVPAAILKGSPQLAPLTPQC